MIGRAQCVRRLNACRQRGLSPYRITLDSVHRLPSKPDDPSDLTDACGLPQHRLRALVLLRRVFVEHVAYALRGKIIGDGKLTPPPSDM
jgi:hypothetical protein